MKIRPVYLQMIVFLACAGMFAAFVTPSASLCAPQTVSPLPKAVLGKLPILVDQKYSYHVSSVELASVENLYLEGGNGLCNLIGYNITIVPKLGHLSQIHESGSKISQTSRKFFEQLHPGDMVIMDGIRIYDAGTRSEAVLAPISIIVH